MTAVYTFAVIIGFILTTLILSVFFGAFEEVHERRKNG